MLFPNDKRPNPPLEWDDEVHYTATNVEVWFQEYMVMPYPKEGPVDVEALRHHFTPQVGFDKLNYAMMKSL